MKKMRKVQKISFSDKSRELLNDWLAGKYGHIVKKDIQEVLGLSRTTLFNYFQRIESGNEKIEDLITFSQLERLIEYQRQLVDAPSKAELEQEKILTEQLKQVNKIRESQGLEKFTLDQFKKSVIGENNKKDDK